MIKHPPLKKEFVFERNLNRFFRLWESFTCEKILESPVNFLWASNRDVDNVFCYQYIAGANRTDLVKYLNWIHQTGLAHFRFVTSEGKWIRFTIDDQHYEVEGQYCSNNFNFYYWLRNLCTSILLRDNAAIKRICQIDKVWFQSVPMGNNPFDNSLMDMIIGAFSGDKNFKQLVIDVMDKSDPKYLTETEASYAYNILLPFSNLLTMAVTRVDEKTYQEAWIKAVDSHKEYWSSNKRLSEEHDGWISFPITAVSSLVYDHKGFKLPKKSEYVPEWLVYGDFEPQPSVGIDFYEGEI